MPIFQFKCLDCLSLFEHLVSKGMKNAISCVSCGGENLARDVENSFYPSKLFCPKTGDLDSEKLMSDLSSLVKSADSRCSSGCASTGDVFGCKGGCGSGSCG